MHNIFLFPNDVNLHIHVHIIKITKSGDPITFVQYFLYQHYFKLTPISPCGIQYQHTVLYFGLYYLE